MSTLLKEFNLPKQNLEHSFPIKIKTPLVS